MAQEQSAYSGTGTVEVLINVVDPATGNHSTATIDTSTTRIDGFSTVPTVTQIGTGGIYKISFSSVTPAPTEGDRLVVKVNGTLTGAASAFTEYGIPVKVIAAETSSFDAATDSVTVGTNNDKTGYSISGSKTTLDALNDFDQSTQTVDIGKINGNATSASNLQKSTSQMVQGTVSSSPVSPFTQLGFTYFHTSDVTYSEEDTFIGRLVIFTSGNLVGQATDITDYEQDTGTGKGYLQGTATTRPPANADTFIIV